MLAGSMAVEIHPCTILAVHRRRDVGWTVAAKRCYFGCYTEWSLRLSKELVLEGKEQHKHDAEIVLELPFQRYDLDRGRHDERLATSRFALAEHLSLAPHETDNN